MSPRAAALLLALSTAWATTKEDDRVASIPGFESEFQKGLGFDVYSGYLDVQVPKAATGYDAGQPDYQDGEKAHLKFHVTVRGVERLAYHLGFCLLLYPLGWSGDLTSGSLSAS